MRGISNFISWILLNLNKLEVFFQNNGPFDWIAHEAGQVAVTTSLISPVDDFKSNTVATINLLESVRKYSPDAKVVYASTNKVYGKLTNLEIRELKNKYFLFLKDSRRKRRTTA